MKKIKSALLNILVTVTILASALQTVSANGIVWYEKKYKVEAAVKLWEEEILPAIDKQSFKTPETGIIAREKAEYFVDHPKAYEQVPNSAKARSRASDLLDYSDNGKSRHGIRVRKSKGCIHYAYFFSRTIYGRYYFYADKAETKENKKYLNPHHAKVTEEEVRTFIQMQFQCGEHFRVVGKGVKIHSMVFLATDDANQGFYYMQYEGDDHAPFLSYASYSYWTKLINKHKLTFYLFNADPSINITVGTEDFE